MLWTSVLVEMLYRFVNCKPLLGPSQVRLVEDPMGQFTVALKQHLKEGGRNDVMFADHSPSKSPVVIKYYQDESERQHNIDLLQGKQTYGKRPQMIASHCTDPIISKHLAKHADQDA